MFFSSVKTLVDAQLGEILFRKNSRAKKYIIRIKSDVVTVTVPRGGTFRYAEQFFDNSRPFILQKKAILAAKKVDNPDIPTDTELRKQALAYLPGELQRLATVHGLHFQTVKIRKSKTRWGSCSSKGSISLSIYLMLLPPYLIEYVLLHELCHTVEMNHGNVFWALLNQHTAGQAKILRKELKLHTIPR
ncbi:zinc protease [Bacteroidia bacterium]|nr:zinc protease [Bacteroidia bacterium]